MKKVWIICLLLIVPAFAFASGVLVEAKGPVEVGISGKKIKPKTGLELPDGSKVQVGKAASAQVMLLNGTIVSLATGESLTVGSKTTTRSKRTTINGIQIALNEASASGAGPTVQGMVKGNQLGLGRSKMLGASTLGIDGLYPVNTTIEPTDSLTIRWSPEAKISWPHPVMVIENKEKKTIAVKPIIANANHIIISSSEAGLVPGGSYRWHLGSKQGDNVVVKSNHFPFRILADDAKQSMATDVATINGLGLTSSDGKNLLLGQVYYKHGLYQKAADTILPVYQSEKGDGVKHVLYVA